MVALKLTENADVDGGGGSGATFSGDTSNTGDEADFTCTLFAVDFAFTSENVDSGLLITSKEVEGRGFKLLLK